MVLTGRAAQFDPTILHRIVEQVPSTTVHRDLDAFADHLMRREHLSDSHAGDLD